MKRLFFFCSLYCKLLTHLERAIELVQQVYNELNIIDASDFSKYMSSSAEKTIFASVVTYTGDCSVNVALFTSETAAKVDCKKQFESTLVEGKKTGDIDSDSDMESIWHDDEMHGTVYWLDDNVSTFEVKAFVLHDSDDTNSDEV